jgi:DNA polymerase III alpha subunit
VLAALRDCHPGAARERLEHELAIIARTHLASCFLTVADVAPPATSGIPDNKPQEPADR